MEPARRLAPLLLLMAGLALSQSASAFSLSEPQLRSRLGQRLDVRLELQHAPGEDPEVRPAGNAEYARLGIDPPSRSLGDLTVEKEPLGPGRMQLRVRSGSRVSEPILTVLIEVREGNTRLVREITTFIDPPPGAQSPDIDPAVMVTATMPPLQGLTLEPSLPSLETPRPQKRERSKPPATDPGPAASPTPQAMPAPAPTLGLSPAPAIRLPRFRLDDHYGSQERAEVKIAPATLRWLRQQNGEQAEPETIASAIPLAAAPAALAAPDTGIAEQAQGDWPPSPWHSFFGLFGLTVAIFAYARYLRRRLMREARADLSLEDSATA